MGPVQIVDTHCNRSMHNGMVHSLQIMHIYWAVLEKDKCYPTHSYPQFQVHFLSHVSKGTWTNWKGSTNMVENDKMTWTWDITCEKKLQDLCLFIVVKRTLKSNLTAACNYWKYSYNADKLCNDRWCYKLKQIQILVYEVHDIFRAKKNLKEIDGTGCSSGAWAQWCPLIMGDWTPDLSSVDKTTDRVLSHWNCVCARENPREASPFWSVPSLTYTLQKH